MKYRLLFLIMVAFCAGFAQERPFLSDKIYDNISADFSKNIYLSSFSTLEKYNSSGNKTRSYSNQILGNISSFDAKLESKILVFYSESNHIILLNNELSEINDFNLLEKGFYDISLASMGSSNRIILYDNTAKQLIITDLNLNTISEIVVNFPYEFNASEIQVIPDHRIALLDTINGICFFDFYGTFEKIIPLRNVTSMQLLKDYFYYYQDGYFYRYEIPNIYNSLEIKEIKAPITSKTKKFAFIDNSLWYINDIGKVFRNAL